jgi:prepilin-type N-terminal cleavage/methylation domain-containing protein
MRRHGFTLMELLIVLVVIAILAAMAVPGYRKTSERQFWQQAQDLLLTIYSGERAYSFANNGNYFAVPPGSPIATWRTIFMDSPDTPQIVYRVQINAGCGVILPCFLARATRNDGSGRNMTINNSRTLNMGAWPQP